MPGLLRGAQSVKRRGGISIVTCHTSIHDGWDYCDGSDLQPAASESWLYLSHGKTADLPDVLHSLIWENGATAPQQLTITDTYPPSIQVLADTIKPPAAVDPRARTLVWSFAEPVAPVITLTYRVQPLALGDHGLGDGSSALLVDTNGVTAAAPLPAYLPLALREQGVPGYVHTDVALVIDASTSMRDEYTTAGRRKLEAACEAVAMFLARLDLAGGDQAAIVQFNADASVLAPLGNDRAALSAALGTIVVARQTRIQAGIHAAREELASPRRRIANNQAMVVLTDGANNPEPVAEAEREAAQAKADGIHVFTIGLGEQVEADALARMARRPEGSFHAPDGENLAAIYERIAYVIPCPPAAFWGRR